MILEVNLKFLLQKIAYGFCFTNQVENMGHMHYTPTISHRYTSIWLSAFRNFIYLYWGQAPKPIFYNNLH